MPAALVHKCSAVMDMGPGPSSTARGAAGPPGPGPVSSWALVLGLGPISTVAEHMCIKGNQKAITGQYIYIYIIYWVMCNRSDFLPKPRLDRFLKLDLPKYEKRVS